MGKNPWLKLLSGCCEPGSGSRGERKHYVQVEPGSEREGQMEGTQPPATMPTNGDRGYKTSLLSHFSHVWLFATLWTVACQAPLSMGFSKQEYWSWLPFPSLQDIFRPPLLCPPDVKNWLIGKDPDAGRDRGQEEKGTTEDERVGWHHRLKGHEFE